MQWEAARRRTAALHHHRHRALLVVIGVGVVAARAAETRSIQPKLAKVDQGDLAKSVVARARLSPSPRLRSNQRPAAS